MLKLLIAACLMVIGLFAAPIQSDKEFQQVVEKMGKEEALLGIPICNMPLIFSMAINTLKV